MFHEFQIIRVDHILFLIGVSDYLSSQQVLQLRTSLQSSPGTAAAHTDAELRLVGTMTCCAQSLVELPTLASNDLVMSCLRIRQRMTSSCVGLHMVEPTSLKSLYEYSPLAKLFMYGSTE